ncbi:recombinase family protein [Hyphomicrobium sp. MC1]|uniref:recombinase family protein n=1 Tax=Hyphomicrobium sp. (strain MC1) TaxID=717785 RepID=UPI000213E6BD|nr:recombinase family protein [Hyphomicrobium sp. MC1]CCB66556.1 putative resolvase [Hyphomicrobium sp. MC1]
MIKVRCAIYTRKSSDEGLEKEFNSLDAQREACEAFIKSQKHAGWTAVSDLYDDGGLSGGTMERPALQRLLGDIKAGKAQIVVVYKVDRLTRSLADFAKIVDIFDAHGASFVSVTQQFNTTTSMGRLTLNMLLSFAQFEREIAGERIRDKIAASKAKGMWMGGTVPLGYDVKDRKLLINPVEAETVRLIFQRYAELGSVKLLQAELDRRGLRSKRREGAKGLITGNAKFSRGILYLILQNHLYRGEVAHKGSVYPGQHEAIIDADLWTVVQDKLATNRKTRSLATGAEAPSLLAGLLFDDDGSRMTPTHANKRGRRYRYYISAALLDTRRSTRNTMRVPANEVEGLVADRVRTLLTSRQDIVDTLAALELNARELEAVLSRAAEFTKQWPVMPPETVRPVIRQVVACVTLSPDQIEIVIDAGQLAGVLGIEGKIESASDRTIILTVPTELRRSGQGKRMVIGDSSQRSPDASLVQVLQDAFSARDKMLSDTTETLNDITSGITKSKGRLTALMRLTYLAPSIVEDIFAGRQPLELSPKRLLRTSQNLPLDWTQQRKFLGFT